MDDAGRTTEDHREIARLRDEAEQLRTALEAASEEMSRLAEDRDRLLRRVTTQARDLQAANTAYSDAVTNRRNEQKAGDLATVQSAQEQEELRVAFEEMQVLSEELEVANTSLSETNRQLDFKVEERTRELKAKNAALSESELRFRTLAEGIPELVWRADDGGAWTWASPQWIAYTGFSLEESVGQGWLRALHPDDRDDARRAWRSAIRSGGLEVESRIQAAGGRYRWFKIRGAPVRDGEGLIIEWLGASTDVEDLRRLQDRQRVLLLELQHRVRNTLAVVRSLAKSTASTSDTVEEFAAHFEGRLNALARTQMVLTRAPGGGVDLEAMVREEMLAQAPNNDQVEVDGPEVCLSAKAAEVLTLAVHELATNSVKYGALATTGGHVDIRWATQEEAAERWLKLEWTESGVRVLASAPRRQGFGTELITLRVPYELRGRGTIELRPGGLRAEIAFPLRPGESILQTNTPGA